MVNLWHKLPQAKQLQSQVENILLFVFNLKQNKPKPKDRIGKSMKGPGVIKEIFWVHYNCYILILI